MTKREDYITWGTYFMEIAKISSQRSKDPNTQVGAVVVGQNNKIIGTGYNGMPRGCSDDIFPWTRPDKHLYVCHAELNAILNANNFNMLEGSTLYSTLFPCNECSKIILQMGIKKVVYLEDKYAERDEFKASKIMFDAANIKYEAFVESIKEPILVPIITSVINKSPNKKESNKD